MSSKGREQPTGRYSHTDQAVDVLEVKASQHAPLVAAQMFQEEAVSYTHLTLPTIYSV